MTWHELDYLIELIANTQFGVLTALGALIETT